MIFSFRSTKSPGIGKTAPDFVLLDQHKHQHQLSNYRGKWLILYFYPKDDTPGCTKEACLFRDDISELHKLGAEVIGISTDDLVSHAKFADKYQLPFSLLSDTGGHIAKKYDAVWKIGPLSIAKVHSLIISPESKIAKIYRKVNPKTHSNTVINDLIALQKVN